MAIVFKLTDSLVLWEAQFGDFANVAQVIIDQFIASGRAKWMRILRLCCCFLMATKDRDQSILVLVLERYLQLAAQDNWRVANCSTAAQYYHLLRLQAH